MCSGSALAVLRLPKLRQPCLRNATSEPVPSLRLAVRTREHRQEDYPPNLRTLEQALPGMAGSMKVRNRACGQCRSFALVRPRQWLLERTDVSCRKCQMV